MKLFRFTVGYDEKFYPFENEREAYERRAEVDPTFTWLPVQIQEISIPGYTIMVVPENATTEAETSELVEEVAAPRRGRRKAV